MLRAVVLLSAATFSAFAQYSVSLTNAASYSQEVAPGSLALVQVNARGSDPGLPVLDPAATVVELTPAGAASATRLPVLAKGSNGASVLVLLPSSIPAGDAELRLTAGDLATVPAQVSIRPSAFGIFQQDRGLMSLVQNPGAVLNSLTHSAKPGDLISVWGTGLGNAAPLKWFDPVDRAAIVLVGGILVQPDYAGPAPGFPGLDQINVRIPNAAELPESCYVGLQVMAGGVYSNLGRIAVSRSGGVCNHPFGFSAETLAGLDAGGTAYLATLDVSSAAVPLAPNTPGYVRIDEATATFNAYDASGISVLAPPVSVSRGPECRGVSGGTAAFISITGFLNAGPSLRLRNGDTILNLNASSPLPSRYTSQLAQAAPAQSVDQVALSIFKAGSSWQLAAPGSDAVGPFETSFVYPGAIRVTNVEELQAIDRTAAVVVRWDAAHFVRNDEVFLTLSGTTRNARGELSAYGISCRVSATDESITIGPEFTSQFVPFTGIGRQPVLSLSVSRRTDSLDRFAVPLRNWEAVPGVIRPTSYEMFNVNFR